jgi:hypothetical protein
MEPQTPSQHRSVGKHADQVGLALARQAAQGVGAALPDTREQIEAVQAGVVHDQLVARHRAQRAHS